MSLCESIPITAMIILPFLWLLWLWQNGPEVRTHALTSPKPRSSDITGPAPAEQHAELVP